MDDQKKAHVVEFIRTLAEIEFQMEPFAQAKRDLRDNYIESNFLSKDEIWQATRAFRFVKKGKQVDIDNFNDMYEELMKLFGESAIG
jgi:hypothetical protein